MSPKRLLGFVLLNIVVSLAVSLSVLALWDRRQPSRAVSPASGTTVPGATSGAGTPGVVSSSGIPGVTATPPGTIYIVKAGDTLSGIAQQYNVSVDDLMAVNGLTDPNVLKLGQTLIIPTSGAAETAVAAATATSNAPPPPIATATPATGALAVTLRGVTSRGDLANEAIILINEGARADLAGWKLSDKQGDSFTFPSLVLLPGAQVQVHTGSGTASPTDLYWGRTAAVWGDRNEVATLTDANGTVVATLQLP